MTSPDRADLELSSLIEVAATSWPGEQVLVSRQGDACTFAELQARVGRMAAGLAAEGIERGDVVSWILPTWVDTVVLAAALARLGAVQNPIIGIAHEREVSFCVDDARARFLLTPTEFAGYDFGAMGERIAASRPHLAHLAVRPGSFPAGDVASLPPRISPPPRETAWICYTSGTTSAPKGARHSDATIGATVDAMAEAFDIVPGDRYALVFPFPHIGGLALLFVALRTGCTLLLDESVHPVATVAFLSDNDCTHAGTGPAFFNMYLAAQAAHGSERLFPHLKVCPSGGAPTPQVYYDRVPNELGGVLVSSWGLTEAPVLTGGRVDDPHEKLVATEGRPFPGVRIRIVDAQGADCPVGVPGEIRIVARQVMLGYQDPALDADAFDEQGYYRTGDLGMLDGDGYLTVTGRLKDVIIRNGESIASREVEELLFGVAGVADAAVIGVPDERTGEAVCAVVVLQREATLTLDQVRDALTAAGLRRQSLPTHLVVRDTLPRNPAGKVLKTTLVTEFLAG